MPPESEIARLVDFAERPRANNWSMRAALTRYAQPQPQRASDVIELMRRIEFALRPYADALVRGEPTDNDAFVTELLAAVTELDDMGDVLAAWAHDRVPERPDALVDATTASVAQRLERLGVPREKRPARPSGRSGRPGRAARGV